MISLAYCGQKDIYFQNIKIHQPTISELIESLQFENNIFFCIKVLAEEEFDKVIMLLSQKELQEKDWIINFLIILFPSFTFTMNKESIILTNEEINQVLILNKDNYSEFQKNIKTIFCTNILFNSDEDNYNPANERARQIAEKLKARHKKLAELNHTDSKKPIIDNYVFIVAVGLRMMPTDIVDKLTIYSLFSLYHRFINKSECDIDLKVRLAGGDPKSSPDNWMRMI